MSLINKMLRGLEQRRSETEASDYDPVLDELSPVEQEELAQEKAGARVVLLAAVLLLIGVVLYLADTGTLQRKQKPQPERVQMQDHSPPAVTLVRAPAPDAASSGRSDVEETATAGDQNGDFGLKIDTGLALASAEDGLFPRTDGPLNLDAIRMDAGPDSMSLNIHLPGKTKYMMYTLTEPNRVVVELANARYQGSLPDIGGLPGVTAIRSSSMPDGTYKLVLESEQELLIDRATMENAAGGYRLSVDMANTGGGRPAVAQRPAVAKTQTAVTGTFSKSPVAASRSDTEQAAAAAPGRAETLTYEGRALYRQGKIKQGLEKILQAVELEPGNAGARTTLAVLLLEQNKNEAAGEVLMQGLRIIPDQTEWAKLLGRILYNEGRLEQARVVLEQAAPAVEANLDYHALYAAVLQSLAEHARAAIVYRNLLKYGGNNGRWWLGLAISLEAMARDSDAIVAYRNALNTRDIESNSADFIKDRLKNLQQRS